jgi:hypothetical protein
MAGELHSIIKGFGKKNIFVWTYIQFTPIISGMVCMMQGNAIEHPSA